MAWIKTVSFEEADEKLQKILLEMRVSFPTEYITPAPKASATDESIVSSHTLIPDALYHAFSTFGSLMSENLPLQRRHHEMIATLVSVVNRCHY
jgi:alkylhydroperoxidase family enzyme